MLTDLKIRNLKPKDRKYKKSDGERLFILVHPNGSKYWVFVYEFGGKQRELSIGKYPKFTLAEARQERIKAQKLLGDNKDPGAIKQQEKLIAEYKNRNLFRDVAEDWYAWKRPRWGDKHASLVWGRLENHVFPVLGRRVITEITRMELLVMAQNIASGGAPYVCSIILPICASIFRYGEMTERCKENPARDIQEVLPSYKAKHYPSINSDEIGGFIQRLKAISAIEQNKIAMLMLMMTAVRTKELRYAEWKEIDWSNRKWCIPAKRMKTRIEHEVPLSWQVIRLLEYLKNLTGDGRYLFPNHHKRKKPVMCENVINIMIHRMGYKGRMVGHGFRSLFSTVLNENSSFSSDAIERQLAHCEKDAVRDAYNRAKYMVERSQMMQWWADYLCSKSIQPRNDDGYYIEYSTSGLID